MDRIAKALIENEGVLDEINEIIFGGGADELIEKLHEQTSEKKKPSKSAYRAALAGNTLAVVGGAHALGLSLSNEKLPGGKTIKRGMSFAEGKLKTNRLTAKATARTARAFSAHPKVAAAVPVAAATGWVGLHAAELASDAYANRAIRQNYKGKQKKLVVAKMSPTQEALHVPGALQIIKPSKIAVLKPKVAVLKPKLKKTVTYIKDNGAKNTYDTLDTKHKLTEQKNKVSEPFMKNDIELECEFSKVDADKRQVFGYASVVKINGEDVVDKQGDHIDIEELEKSAYDYVIKSRKGGNMHRRSGDEPVHVSDMIESFVLTPEKIEKMGLPEDTPLAWWVGFKVNDDETWDEIKSGQKKAFSVHGRGNRVEKVLA